jgi:hypothetical protein
MPASPADRWLVRVVAPSFVAGFTVGAGGRVSRFAPILRRHVAGLTGREAVLACRSKGWVVQWYPCEQ